MGLFFNDIVINICSDNDRSTKVANTSNMNVSGMGPAKGQPLADKFYMSKQGYDSFTDFLEDKVSPEDLRQYQELFLNTCKKEGIKNVYVDHKHRKKYSGAYIASYKETPNVTITELVTEILNKILNDPKFSDKQKKVINISLSKLRSKYNFAILREEPVGSNKIYVIILTPKNF